MKNSILSFLFCLMFFMTSAQKDVNVPDTNSFNSGAGSTSSVNQANGKLTMTLPLISLEGFKDLSASFSIGYDGGNVSKTASASSEYAPTGILGLGWGTQFSRIVVDNKLTAARDDDTFFMLEGGLNELIATEKTSNTITFKSKMKKPWKIKYYTNDERWEIIKENGYTYKYDNVDYVVYWENWIGNSNLTGADRQGSSWNLTEVVDLYGNKVSYEYTNVEQSVLNTAGVKHTEATYLDKIIGPCGEEIQLVYGDKTSGEYFESNTERVEPDAYQEVYDKKFLDKVQAYDSSGTLLNEYDFKYIMTGSGNKSKRLLTEIILESATGEQQTFREFEYEMSTSSEYYGLMNHQILPTKGRISYQYQVNEIPVDQTYDTSASDNTTFFIQENYILKLTGTNELYILTWTGSTWEEELFHSAPAGGDFVSDEKHYKSMHVVARKDFFALLHSDNPNPVVVLAGREANGKTWKKSGPIPIISNGLNGLLDFSVFGGNNFVAVGNPINDYIKFYRWDGEQWHTENIGNGNSGEYFYTAANNYLIQHTRKSGLDAVKLYYYDILGNLQLRNISSGLDTSGSVGNLNYWYGQNSFALVNANGNPEYVYRWDKNYNYIAKDEPFGMVDDKIDSYGLFNSYFAVAEDFGGGWPVGSLSIFTRYKGNGIWQNKTAFSAPFIKDVNTTGFGADLVVHPANSSSGSNIIHHFNANSGNWVTDEFDSGSTIANNQKRSFDIFANRYVFANRSLYKVNPDQSVDFISNQPDNTSFSYSDGGNLLYVSSRGGGTSSGSAFAKALSMTQEGTIETYSISGNYRLHENKYRNFPSHAIGYGALAVRQDGGSTAKIYKMIDGKLTTNNQGQTVYNDVVIAKETFDPVITRKQRNYYCYSNPHPSKDNMRVNYQYVSQFNDLNAILGKTVTTHDTGTTDDRRIGLPTKIRVYDADDELVSEQVNDWDVNDFLNTYYINLGSKMNHSFEGGNEIISTEKYTYDYDTGMLTEKEMTDSEGNREIARSTYVYEVYSEAATQNILSPVAKQEQLLIREDDSELYKSASAVQWDFSSTPRPGSSYSWNGQGSIPPAFDFTASSHLGYRSSQQIDVVDGYGNVIQETNRSSVITSYLYGYQGKRMVAKIEGATHAQASSAVNMTIINNPSSESALQAELDHLRSNLPSAFVTSYTYRPSVGLSTKTDVRGRTQSYLYDDFFRLDHVKNEEGNILKKSSYNYREAPFTYSSESNVLPDCEITGTPETDPTDVEPITIALVKITDSPSELYLRATPSDGGNYTYDWTYGASSGDASDFTFTEQGRYFDSTNPDCNDGVLYIFVRAMSGSQIIAQSNTVNHTFSSSSDCYPK